MKIPAEHIEGHISRFLSAADKNKLIRLSYVQEICRISYAQAKLTVQEMMRRSLVCCDTFEGGWRLTPKALETNPVENQEKAAALIKSGLEMAKRTGLKVVCSVDISTCDEDADSRCFGEFEEINAMPNSEGFGLNELQLLFAGSLNNN